MKPSRASSDNHPTWKLAIGWCLAVVAIYGGVVWFSSESLQNNADIQRLDIWFAIPDLLGEYISPAVAPNQPLPAPSGWIYFPKRLPPLLYSFGVLASSCFWGSLVIRHLIPRLELMDQLEKVYWSLVTGLVVVGTITLLLGLCGWLSSPLFSR